MMSPDQQEQVIRESCLGNQDAYAFCMMLVEVVNIWDDIVDEEKVNDEHVHRGFMNCIIGFNRNKFFRAYVDELLPLIEVGIINWLTSNTYERSGSVEDKISAHFLRHSIADVLTFVARVVGGFQHARQMAPLIIEACRDDNLREYLREIENGH